MHSVEISELVPVVKQNMTVYNKSKSTRGKSDRQQLTDNKIYRVVISGNGWRKKRKNIATNGLNKLFSVNVLSSYSKHSRTKNVD